MPLNAQTKILHAAMGISSDTASAWNAHNPILPMGVMGWETDTGKIKIGNGTNHWNSLTYKIDAVLTQAQKTLLDNAGQANGVIVAGADGKISAAQLPSYFGGSIQYVPNITARDALTVEQRTHALIIVIDATGDSSVASGAAQYFWDDAQNKYVKIAEQESLDVTLVDYFHLVNHNLSHIADGGGYVKMTTAERTKLADTVCYTDSILITGPTAFELLNMISD